MIDPRQACRALEWSISKHWPRYGSVQVEYLLVEVINLRTVISRIAPRRLQKATDVLLDVLRSGPGPYLPVIYSGEEGRDQVAFGPLVERNGSELLLIDGVHRSLAAMNMGIPAIQVATITTEVIPPPPGEVRRLAEVQIADTNSERLPPFPGKHGAQFRPSTLFTSAAGDLLLGGEPHLNLDGPGAES